MKKTLRQIQSQKANEAHLVLSSLGCVYIAGQVRSGKSATSLEVARLGEYKNVLCLTKKKAISSIIEDYNDFDFDKYFELTVLNDESMHKLVDPDQYDLIIHDEHHRFGACPKPGKATRLFREYFYGKPVIFLSGTPCPEGPEQYFHQFWVTPYGPWKEYSNLSGFYKWARSGYVDVREKKLPHGTVIDWKRGVKDKIRADVKPYEVTMTQEESGFKSKVEEEILYVDMLPQTYSLCNKLMKDLVVEGKEELILADTPTKLQQKLHQMYSGTIKFESGNKMVLDYSKVEFIQSHFIGHKLAIFYKFTQEYVALKDKLGDKLTNDIQEFNSDPNKWIALQVVSGREGVNLSAADYLVMLNIDFSATSYWQARDRMTVQGRESNKVYWIFSKDGIEDKIMKAVTKKKNFTTSVFKREYKIK